MPAVIIRKDDELMHWGILGMKWGVRRYRNPDGTLTEAGRKRYSEETAKETRERFAIERDISLGRAPNGRIASEKDYRRAEKAVASINRSQAKKKAKEERKKLWNRNIKQGKDKPNTSAVEYIARNGKTIADEAIKTGKTIATGVENARKRRTFKNNAEGKSDQELRDRISRIRLEREYNSLTNDDTSRGYDVAMNVLNVAGSVASVALATVGIAATIKSIKG